MDYYFDPYALGMLEKRPKKGTVIVGVTDEKGNFPERTKRSHPYSYDPICHYMNGAVKPSETVYHDRMEQWDYKKFRRVVDEHCKHAHSFSNPTAVQNILRDYFDDQLIVLTCIVEYCNASSGYACFRFDYFQEPK